MRAVLTYHSIDDSGSSISVRPDAFERHVRWLASGRVQVMALDDLARSHSDAPAVALTFDDGFENFATHAAPLLRVHGFPATVFVVTDRVGGTNDWNGTAAGGPILPLLDWPALERLAAAGIEIGAHTRTHRDLTQIEAAAMEDEIAGSAECLRRRIGVAPKAFAYPYGQLNQAVSATVAANFAWGCTTEHRPFDLAERPALLPRLDMYYYRSGARLDAWDTPSFRRHLRMTQQRRRLRSLLGLAWNRRP